MPVAWQGDVLKVLYLSPAEGEPSGLVDYGKALRRAAAGTSAVEYVPGEVLGTTRVPWRADGLAARVDRFVDGWASSDALAGFDLVHLEIAGASYREYYFARALTRRRLGPPRVVTLHDPPYLVGRTWSERWPARGLPARLIRRACELTLGHAEERRILERAGAVITLSGGGAAAVRRRFRGLRVPVSVVEHIGFPAGAGVAAGGRTEPITILWLGYLLRGAGFELLLDALEEIEKSGNGLPPWRLDVAGAAVNGSAGSSTEPSREVERRGLKGHVRLLGFIPDQELAAVLARSQILVVPRERRGWCRQELQSVSGSMIRAMSAGLAVVASDARAAAEEIVSGKSGLLVGAGDAHGLAEAIRSLVVDPALRERLGREAQEHVRREHAPAKIMADHLSVYRSVLRSAGNTIGLVPGQRRMAGEAR